MEFSSFVMILFLTKLLHNLHLILFEEEIRFVIREHCVITLIFQFKSWKKLFSSSSPAATAVPAPRVSLPPTGVGAVSDRGVSIEACSRSHAQIDS